MPGIFSNFKYKEPERLSPDEIRQRRFLAELTKQRKALEAEPERLSPANKFHYFKLKEFERKFGDEIEARRRHAERSAADERSKSRLFQLLTQHSELKQRASKSFGTQGSQKQFGDRPFRKQSFINDFGHGVVPPGPKATASMMTNFAGKQFSKSVFYASPKAVSKWTLKNIRKIVPCADRAIRREVLFAKGHGGKGHRSPKHKSPWSHIGC